MWHGDVEYLINWLARRWLREASLSINLIWQIKLKSNLVYVFIHGWRFQTIYSSLNLLIPIATFIISNSHAL